MKTSILYIIILLAAHQMCFAQSGFRGTVISSENLKALTGAAITIKGTSIGMTTDSLGRFTIVSGRPEYILVVTYMGYKTREVPVSQSTGSELLIKLEPSSNTLAEVVVSTGYQDVNRERATGSFTLVSKDVLDRSVSTNIISKLEGVTNGLSFNRRLSVTPDKALPELNVRGLSTIYANAEPLIVVDNFPFDGNINSINPNDIESVTVLKDAAAASIWGARAGNGVIVITTRKGRYNQGAKIEINTSASFTARPDLKYNPNYLSSQDFINVERQLFDRNYYTADENNPARPPLTPVVELLIAKRDGKISSEQIEAEIESLKKIDARSDLEEYFYRSGLNRQTSLNVSGGSGIFNYYVSGGFDKNEFSSVGNAYKRFSLKSQNVIKPLPNLEITTGINYIQSNTYNNGLGVVDINPGGGKGLFPYARFRDEGGNPLSLVRSYRSTYVANAESSGLLNWQYRPLEEVESLDNTFKSAESRINTSIRYSFFNDLDFDLKYQYHRIGENSRNLQSEKAFSTRDLINRYTQANGVRIIPEGGILSLSNDDLISHSGRAQANFNQSRGDSRISAMAGMEVRETKGLRHSSRIYGYDDEVLNTQPMMDYITRYPTLPRGSATVSTGLTPLSEKLDRFVSYYTNASYEYKDRYMISGSARQDASNLFGVKTNQKWVPLWSTGLGWRVSAEPFYTNNWLPYLKLRGTYGFNGNIDKTVTAFPILRYGNDGITGLPNAQIENPGNPELRWERVGILNLGLDFSSKESRVSGSIDIFRKYGKDLLGDLPLDPTSGFLSNYKVNYADMQTSGIDLQLNTINLRTEIRWETGFLFSYAQDKVTRFNNEGASVGSYFAGFSLPQIGKSLYRIYSYPSPALESTTGDPVVMVNGALSKDYSTYMRVITPEELVDHGPQAPPLYGSVMNTVSFRGISISTNITWKAGYFFRRSTIAYDALFRSWKGHEDFSLRWQKPGDELVTSVPSMPLTSNTNRDYLHSRSAGLVEKGDHVRLEDFSISYKPKLKLPGVEAGNLKVYLYANNLGLLWSANKKGLDPDYPNAVYLVPRTVSLGINANF